MRIAIALVFELCAALKVLQNQGVWSSPHCRNQVAVWLIDGGSNSNAVTFCRAV